jgi:hypothetical protein
MDDEELYVPDDVLEEANAAGYQMLLKKSKLRYQKELEKFSKIHKVKDGERKTMSESDVNERETFTHW